VTDPYFDKASPVGWHDQGTTKYTNTIGNNVYAQENPTGGSGWLNNYRPNGGNTLNFNFAINFANQPAAYRDAAITNLFYWNNFIHDVFYMYGFDERSGNFQENNFGRGGLGNDAVQANAQDGAGFNNANFATPPDGQRPRMRMYVWNRSTPNRDGDLDSGIIVHEYGHGISTRLTGGPGNSNCLGSGQPGGMGEGWGDFWAIYFEQRAATTPTTRFPMGSYAANSGGIRPYPYTTEISVNPQTFAYINRNDYTGVHAKGSVWCTALYEVLWALRTARGFNPDWYEGNGGNNIFFRNVVDGLKLQPCRPSFVDARDAILLADRNNYGSANTCIMWRAFAKRGLGVNARAVEPVTENFQVPANC
jgi:extracellular elastinolytic metalloproteinase